MCPDCKKLQTEIKELREVLQIPPLKTLFSWFSPQGQKALGRLWRIYCSTYRPYRGTRKNGEKIGGRGKPPLDDTSGWSRTSFERFLSSLYYRYSEEALIRGVTAYLNSDWVRLHSFDMLIEKSVVRCCNIAVAEERRTRW